MTDLYKVVFELCDEFGNYKSSGPVPGLLRLTQGQASREAARLNAKFQLHDQAHTPIGSTDLINYDIARDEPGAVSDVRGQLLARHYARKDVADRPGSGPRPFPFPRSGRGAGR